MLSFSDQRAPYGRTAYSGSPWSFQRTIHRRRPLSNLCPVSSIPTVRQYRCSLWYVRVMIACLKLSNRQVGWKRRVHVYALLLAVMCSVRGWQHLYRHLAESMEPHLQRLCNSYLNSIAPLRPQRQLSSECRGFKAIPGRPGRVQQAGQVICSRQPCARCLKKVPMIQLV